MAMTWPDYMSRRTLAKRLDLEEAAVDQYVKRGQLPGRHSLTPT